LNVASSTRHHRGLTISIDQPALLFAGIARIRATAPLIHSITNFVVMNTTANALLALGASPVMAHAAEEVEDLAEVAGALVINIGTLTPAWVDSMRLAMRSAARAGRPIVFDPVGAGATRYRTATCLRLLEETPPSIVRGNASEIRALAGDSSSTKGVDSTDASESALESARTLAARFGCVVVVSGAVDLIVSAQRLARVSNGHPMMPRVTGLGCTATALIGAFAAVNPALPDAAAHAMATMGIAGELAAAESPGPGSFQVNFLDALYRLSEADIRARLKMDIA
jgi:hydroxyethylthiazole kinase